MVVNVRELRFSDVSRFLELALSNVGELEAQLGLQARSERQLRPLESRGAWFLLRFLRLLGRSPVRLFVAEDRGTLVGTTVAVLLGPWAYVAAVGVREDHRRAGVAQALVRRAEEVGERARKDTMVLEVDAKNEAARSLYAKLGWSTGPLVRWWELPSQPPPVQGVRARPARRQERTMGHEASAARLGFDFPGRFLHPCEFVCRGPGGRHGTWAAGPVGSPSLVVRYWAGAVGESGFLLPVTTSETPAREEDVVLEAGRAELLRSGNQGLYVPVLGDDPHLEELLRTFGGSPKVASEIWWKRAIPV